MKRFPLGLVISGTLTVSLFLALFFDPVLYEWSGNHREYDFHYLYFCFSPFLAMLALLALAASKAPGRGPFGLVRVLMPLPIIAGMLVAIRSLRSLWQTECDEMRFPEVYWDNYLKCEVGWITVIMHGSPDSYGDHSVSFASLEPIQANKTSQEVPAS